MLLQDSRLYTIIGGAVGFQALIILAAIGIKTIYGIYSSKGIKTINEFGISRGFFSSFAIIATIVASFVGGGVIVGTAEKCYYSGIGPLIGLLGFPLQLLLTGLIIAPRIQKYKDTLTVGDIIGAEYGKAAKMMTGILWVLFCTGIIGAQISALSYALSIFLPTPHHWNIGIGASIIIFYCFVGGIRAVISTDVLQFIVLGIAIPLTFILTFFQFNSLQQIVDSVPADYFSITHHFSGVELFVLFFSFLLGDALIPPVIQRLLIAKDAQQAKKTMIWGSLLTLPLCLIGGGFGIIAYALNPSIEPSQSVIYLFQTALPGGFEVIAITGLIAVIMSSADSYLNSASVSFVNDIFTPLLNRKLLHTQELNLARSATLIVGSVAVIFTLAGSTIFDILLYSYKFWGPTLVIPIGALFLDKPVNKVGFFASSISGLLVAFVWDLANFEKLSGIGSLLPGIVANGCTYTLSYLLEIKPDPNLNPASKKA